MALPELDPLEIATGYIVTERRETPSVPLAAMPPHEPLVALEHVMLPALQRSPCLVAFSGGRDSSAVLAVATATARRHGLPDPVPITVEFPSHPRTHEREWQEDVVRHLGLTDWERVVIGHEPDIGGPVARRLLREHGLFWPSGVTTQVPLVVAASGGSLLTGNGGDEVMSPWPGRWLRRTVRLQEPPTRWAAVTFALAALPRPVRTALWRRRRPVRLDWLTPAGNDALSDIVARDRAMPHGSWAAQLEHVVNSRTRELWESAFGVVAGERDVLLVEPLFSPEFAAAVVAHGPRWGYASRNEMLEEVFGGLLPDGTLTRSTKATFTEVFFGPGARAFAAGWDGTGIDTSIVDPDGLRRAWARDPHPDMRTYTLLQQALLHQLRQAPDAPTERVVSSRAPTTS